MFHVENLSQPQHQIDFSNRFERLSLSGVKIKTYYVILDLPGDELWRRLAERIESSRVDCDAVQANLLMAETHHYEVVSFRSVKVTR